MINFEKQFDNIESKFKEIESNLNNQSKIVDKHIINLLEKKVKPERLSKGATLKKYPWWLLTRPRPEMTDLLKFHKSVLVTCRHQSNWLVAKLKSKYAD